MDRFVVKDIKRNSEKSDATITTTEKKRVKARKYDEAYLSLGFTSTMIGQEEGPQCVVCLKILAADSLKHNKMKTLGNPPPRTCEQAP